MKATKKRHFFPALLLACLLLAVSCACAMGEKCEHSYDWNALQHNGEEHWLLCQDCGREVLREQHNISCSTGTCRECGAKGTGIIIHNFDWSNPQSNETEHWTLCQDCDEEKREKHRISCKTRVCEMCSKAGKGEISHAYDWDNWQGDSTQHWVLCKDCGEEREREEHRISCVTGQCRVCGKKGNGKISHKYDLANIQFNETEHWLICEDCGEEEEHEKHWISCKTGLCTACRQAGEGEITHNYDWSAWKSNETQHWLVCQDCGEESERLEHNISCTTGLCRACGQAGEGEITHNYDWSAWESSRTEHWHVCQDCGEEEREKHWISCKTGLCRACDRAGEGEITHNYDWSAWESNETQHWLVCQDCGEIGNKEDHWISCKTGRCINCDQEGTGYTYHDYGDWSHSETQHWRVCLNCGEAEEPWNHQISCQDGKCIDCGYAGQGTLSHEYAWDDWKYTETECWHICEACGEEADRYPHIISCKTGQCLMCGHKGTGYIQHNLGDYQHSETEHWQICTDCGAKDGPWKHWISCKTGLCVDCGQAGEGIPSHKRAPSDWQHNDEDCWTVCADCGEEIDRMEHQLSCKTGKCIRCGYKGTGEIAHRETNKWEYNDTECWEICPDCGQEFFRGGHQISCVTGVCEKCHQKKSGEISHLSASWMSDGTKHWQICRDCGKTLFTDTHKIDCQTGLCVVCGIKGTGEAAHTISKWLTSETEHWGVCLNCGQEVYRTPHNLSCQTGACIYCNRKGQGETWHAVRIDDWQYTDAEHWNFCPDCKQKVYQEPHEWADGVCAVCGCPAPERIPGDANSDGKVTTADVLQLLKYVSGWGVEVNAANSDVTGDGKITTADVLLLLKYVSGWGVTLK